MFLCGSKQTLNKMKRIYTLLAVLFMLPIGLLAQVTTSSITGVILSDKNEGLEGATVKVSNTSTGFTRFTKSRQDGRYDLSNLNPGGPYKIEVTYVGQTIKSKDNIYLELGNSESIDFLAEGSTTELESVVITSGRTTRTIKTGTSTNFGQRQITTVPNISRSITNLTTLTPQAGAGNSFGGRDGRYNNIQIDGAAFNNNFGTTGNALPGGVVSPISLDAIDEITVSVSPYDVRQANFTGAGISATTKRGTNNFKGSAYGYYRNEGFVGRKADGKDIPPLVQSSSKTYGALLGGPIIKDKLFFFINAEKVTTDQPGVNWKAARDGVNPNDPNATRVLASDLDRVRNHLKTQYGYETGNYENLPNFLTGNKKILGRLDWNINTKHSASFRYNYSITEDDQLLNGTSAPNPRGSSSRWSRNAMSYENSNYANSNVLSSYAFELKSNFNSRFSNQFLATYTKSNDPKRSSRSSIFPFIDIQKPQTPGGALDNYISAGYELFSFGNDVINNSATFNNNITYNAGKHSITAGLAYENIYVKNFFLRYGTSYYRYSSVDDFINNRTPNAFALTIPTPGRNPFVELNFGQASVYAQDEINVNQKLKITIGLRADKALFTSDLLPNNRIDSLTFSNLDGQPYKYSVSNWPKERTYFSPRVGVNYDVYGDKNLILRGGAGIFTGRFPFVWFTNQPSNSGTSVVTYEAPVGQLGNFLFKPDPFAYASSVAVSGMLPIPSSLAEIDQSFRMPQVFRVSAAVDKKIGNDWTLTLEGIYNKDINALVQYNANQKAPIGVTAGAGSRPLFGNSNATRRVIPNIAEAMVLTNTNEGSAAIFTAQVSKRFNKNWDFSAAYTHTESFDVSGNPGAQAASAWSGVQSTGGNNDLGVAYSDFGTANRIVAYGSYKINYLKYFATTLSLVLTGYEQGRFGYRYSNDFNQDGLGTNDLLYIPRNPGEITFAQNGAFTPQQQSDAFFAYVKQDKYLSKHQGQFAERNGAKLPWFTNLDLRILQDILPIADKRNYGLQFSMEIENFTNMINNDWGVTRRVALNNAAPLAVAAAPTATTPATFRLNTVNNQLPTRTFEPNVTAANTWRMNLGLRLNF